MKLGEKRDIRSLLVQIGVAFIFSLAGFFMSRNRTKRTKPPPLPPSLPHFSGHNSSVESGQRAQHKDDTHSLKSVPRSCSDVSVAAQRHEESYKQKVVVNSVVGLSPSSRHGGDNDNGYLLPEFNGLVRELDFGSTNSGFSLRKDAETPRSDVETPRAFTSSEKDDYEQEVRHLKNMVRMLREREKNFEVQLLEYYGLKEQETVVMELQNRLKVNNMETKLLNLKIESLKADNERLEAQAADHAKIVAELEAARSKIKLLKKKLRSEAEHNREQILAVQKRVSKLQEQEYKTATIDADTQSRLQRLKVLEGEAEDLRKSNLRLQLENSELARKLEYTQTLVISVMEDPETEALKEISETLREENETLTKKIDQLQADKCAGVEELVYLKWINACLRYELRNYQAPAGKTVARDLSKTLSPKSEEKAKKLILEYGNTEGVGNMMDLDSDRWSSSQASYFTDSESPDNSFVDKSSATKTNTSSKVKFFHKLKELIRGKDDGPRNPGSFGDKTASFEDSDSLRNSSSAWTGANASSEVSSKRVVDSSLSSPRRSLDIQRSRSIKKEDNKNRRNSDSASSYGYNKFASVSEVSGDLENQPDEDANLLKFAEVLKSSHGSKKGKLRRNSA